MPSQAQVRLEVQGGTTQDVDITEGASVGAMLQGQGLSPEALDVLVNGQRADVSRVLSAGDTVLAVPSRTAPAREAVVRVGRFPGKPQDLQVQAGTSIKEVLDAAGLDPRGFDVRRNGLPVDLNETVQDGDQIALYRPVQGNREKSEIEAAVNVHVAA